MVLQREGHGATKGGPWCSRGKAMALQREGHGATEGRPQCYKGRAILLQTPFLCVLKSASCSLRKLSQYISVSEVPKLQHLQCWLGDCSNNHKRACEGDKMAVQSQDFPWGPQPCTLSSVYGLVWGHTITYDWWGLADDLSDPHSKELFLL